MDVELVTRVLVAAVLGAVLGLEREIGGHDPGIRTHALVAIGAALFTVAGAYGFADVSGGASADPTRIAAQVAAGIGFIGAGAVLRSGGAVRGLTTASTLWLSAAIGVACGAGLYVAVAAAALIGLLVLVGLRVAKPGLLARFGGVHRLIRIEYQRGHGTLGPVMRQLEELNCRVDELRVDDDDDVQCVTPSGLRRVTMLVRTNDEERLVAAVSALERRHEILAIAVEPLAG